MGAGIDGDKDSPRDRESDQERLERWLEWLDQAGIKVQPPGATTSVKVSDPYRTHADCQGCVVLRAACSGLARSRNLAVEESHRLRERHRITLVVGVLANISVTGLLLSSRWPAVGVLGAVALVIALATAAALLGSRSGTQ